MRHRVTIARVFSLLSSWEPRNRRRRGHLGRLVILAMAFLLVFQAVATDAIAAGPSASPSAAPSTEPASAPPSVPGATPDPGASPTLDPASPTSVASATSPTPTAAPGPTAVPAPSSAPPKSNEIPALRTESSQTFDNHDGTFTTDYYTDPIFYKPAGSATFVPIEVGFAPATNAGDAVAVSDKAPSVVAIAPADSAAGFLRLTRGATTVAFGLSAAGKDGATKAVPSTDGPVADFPDFLPGVDLRVLARADGAKSFFTWDASPADPTITVTVAAPGLSPSLGTDGTIVFSDADGKPVGHMPKPFAVDSSVDEVRGGRDLHRQGHLRAGPRRLDGHGRVDPAGSRARSTRSSSTRPSTGTNAGSNTYGDAHIASNYPTTNFADYRPTRIRPTTTSSGSATIRRAPPARATTTCAGTCPRSSGRRSTRRRIDIYPYHQYYKRADLDSHERQANHRVTGRRPGRPGTTSHRSPRVPGRARTASRRQTCTFD